MLGETVVASQAAMEHQVADHRQQEGKVGWVQHLGPELEAVAE